MKSILIFLSIALAGCTSIDVQSGNSSLVLDRVCIRENPKVLITDYLEIVRDGFDRHGIASKVISEDEEADCDYVVTYTALRSWDIVPYLSYGEVNIDKNGKRVAQAIFHLRAKGGLSPYKWDDTRTKMYPVMEELLKYQNHPWLKRGL